MLDIEMPPASPRSIQPAVKRGLEGLGLIARAQRLVCSGVAAGSAFRLRSTPGKQWVTSPNQICPSVPMSAHSKWSRYPGYSFTHTSGSRTVSDLNSAAATVHNVVQILLCSTGTRF